MASTDVVAQSDDLGAIFLTLRNKNPTTRLQGAVDLRRYVSTSVAEMTSDAAAKLWDNTINRGIFDLIHSTNTNDQLGGLLAIDNLLDQGGEVIERNRNLFRFYNYVKSLLPNADINIMLAASKTLGQIAKNGGTTFGDNFIVMEVSSAIELLQQESSRYAGILILKELARNSSGYFHMHINLVFDKIMVPLRDTRIIVREGAAELLAACLDIITKRDRAARAPLTRIAMDAANGLKAPQAEILHGSLLIYRTLLTHGGSFMRESYLDVSNRILNLRSHKDPAVKRMVITLIPTLASFDKVAFCENSLHVAAAHLIAMLDKPLERSFAFIALGHMAVSVGAEIRSYLENIMNHIKMGFEQRGKKNAPAEEPLFQCIGMLAQAVGQMLTKLLHEQLDLMFAGGLNEPLRQALVAIEEHIKPLRRPIQDRLLDTLSMVLSGQPYKPLGAPAPIRPETNGNHNAAQTAGTAKTPELITLALDTLGSFNFKGHTLHEMARSCVLPYLEDDYTEVRRSAAITCCSLFVNDPIMYHVSNHAIEVISDVVDKLLVVGIADPDPSIRQTVLSSLHDRFDKHLAQAENVRSLFIALNDEVFENRLTAVTLIGRLAMHNPAYVMPSLRKSLIQLLTELEYSTVQRHREECTHLLVDLVGSTHRLIKPYAIPMIKVLLPKAGDANITVASYIILCLGELVCAGGEDALPLVPDLMAVIMPRLSDTSLPKRDAALITLGKVCANTSYVIEPLIDYPEVVGLLGRILKSEAREDVKREVIRVFGILGAMDPFRRNRKPKEESKAPSRIVPAVKEGVPSATGDDYYQKVAIQALLGILKDPSLNTHHHGVIEGIMSMFKTQGLKCVAFLPQIIPAFTAVTRSSAARVQDFHLQQLAILVGIIKQHVRGFMQDIVNLITDLWENQLLQLPLVSLIEGLGKALEAEFKPFLPTVLPLLLKVFDGEVNDKNEKKTAVQIKIFDAFFTFGSSIEEYMHLVIPIIVRTYERNEAPLSLRKRGVQTIDGLSRKVNFSDHASRIIHPLVRVLRHCVNELWIAVMDCLCSLVIQLGADFAIFIPTIQKTLHSTRMNHAKYENLISKLLNGERLPRDVATDAPQAADVKVEERPAESTKLTVNQQHLKQAWDISNVGTRDEWRAWLHRLAVELMRESPSHALRACMTLVDVHPPLSRELFNAAFISCWSELYDQYQDDLVRALEKAMDNPDAPSELVITLLNLAEFMEHEEKPLPIEARVLGAHSAKFNAWAKALHYRELEYFQDASLNVMEALISINTKLQQQDSAWGVLTTAREQYNTTGHEEWYEKLGKWHDALELYQGKLNQDPERQDAVIGRMRCLHALGEWDQLSLDIGEYWTLVGSDERREIAPMAAAAAWSLNDWPVMKRFVEDMSDDLADKAFYNAIYQVHDNNFVKAHASISRARDLLEPDMVAVVGEGYGRSYNVMVRAQMLSELEEIISYRESADQPERQATMRKTWMKRIVGCQPDVDVWQRILQVRSLVLKPEDDSHMWIKFANLCRKNKRMALAQKSIGSLLPHPDNLARDNSVARAAPHVVYAQLKFLWAHGAQERAHSINALLQFTDNLSRDLAGRTERQSTHALPTAKMTELSVLLSKCYLKLGEWQVEVGEDWGRRNAQDILHSYLLATRYDPTSYKAWHTWALANFELVSYLDSHQEGRADDIPSDSIASHTVQAITGFFRSIQLRSDSTLQDILRLLTLWFKYGAHGDVSHAMSNGFAVVEVDTWLDVIPQIIARIQTPSANVRRTISSLLTDIGKVHPQAMVYPLTVASKSSSAARRHAAEEIMQRMREHSPAIVEQAMLVSEELIRVAILWHEMWHEGLEEASRLYFTEKNPEAMIAVLDPLHDLLEAGPTTARETSFSQVFGRDLYDAREACRRYRSYGDHQELDRAWDIYYGVFKKIEKQLPQLMNLDLQYVSPELLASKDLELAVPGIYRSGAPIVKIARFSPKLNVIASKQRPRKVALTGDDGRVYEYVLKGHEDLRQDERVMQLFSLVNDLLIVDSECFKRRLNIRRYPIIPLAPNAGLIGWVQDSDTLHVLVRDYRDARKVLINIEYRLMLQMAPDYENLTLIQKCEVFEYALENTTGQDLYRVLWFKSDNSEHWLERRTIYTRSLAVNSMVGHILGLGDRHPSNLLLERKSGKVVHIDFGDCFEVAMHREKFPERIPFRLTRMLTNAMEVSGIIGSFRITCVHSMGVLRENKESLLAVLEAFVYDPLINWRLMQHDMETRRPEPEVDSVTANNKRRAEQHLKATAHPQGVNKKLKADENEIFNDGMGDPAMREEVRNHRALVVYKRVEAKLTGRDFDPNHQLTVDQQVDRLIQQATSIENLCQCFSGWCAFW